MKVRLPVMIKDPMHSEYLGVPLTETWHADNEEYYLDGPVTPRVAVIDFHPKTGALSRGVRFLPPTRGRKIGEYDVGLKPNSNKQVNDPKFIRVCACPLCCER